jgi:uncharacterized protein
MLLRKNLSLSDVNLKMEGDTGTFEGYASVFGGVDSYGDTIIKGAFESTLRTKGQPKLFLEHAWAGFAVSGSAALPIGKCTCKEDDHGLLLTGQLTPGMSVSNDVRAAMKHGTIDGLSIGGFVKKGDYEETETGRIIRKWSHLVEVSVVAMPADSAARVDLGSVKSGTDILEAINEIATIRDLENLLRDAAGFSKGAACALAARVKTLFAQGDPGAAEVKAIAQLNERIQRITGLL